MTFNDNCVSSQPCNIDISSSNSNILLCNANGINGKFRGQLFQSLNLMEKEGTIPLAICITECKLNEHAKAPDLSSFGYSSPFNHVRSFTNDNKRHSASGGVTVYVHKSVGCSRRSDLENKDVEIVWVELLRPQLHLHPAESLLLGVAYRPPTNSTGIPQLQQWQLMKSNISNALSSFDNKGPILVLGDWNTKTLNSIDPDSFDSFVDDHFLHVLTPPDNQITYTRAAADSGANDFGICSVDTAVAAVEVPNLGLTTDHFPVLFHLLSSSLAQEEEKTERSVWNKEGNSVLYRLLIEEPLKALTALLHHLQDKEEAATDAEYDILAQRLIDLLKEAGLICFGKKQTKRAVLSWSKSTTVNNAFKALKEAEAILIDDPNELNNISLQEARTAFHSIRTEKESEAWSQLRNKMHDKQKQKLLHILLPQQSDNINLLDIHRPVDQHPCNSRAEAAEVLVHHYANVCSLPEDPSFCILNKREVESSISNISKSNDNKEDNSLKIAQETIASICKKLNKHSASGPDDIPPILLTEGGRCLFSFLSVFFTALLHRGFTPAIFKLAYIFPIFKGEKSSRADPASYRPISLTSVIAKTMERCILPILQSRISPFLSSSQAGFRSSHSTIDQIYILSRHIHDAVASIPPHASASFPVAFLDLSKAFDRVWHDGLLFKLQKCGVDGKLWWWLKSFLSNRTICVNTQGTLSSSCSISAGVPQGSVLSPTLFLVFINDIVECRSGCDIRLWADDITVHPHQLVSDQKRRNSFIGQAQLSLTLGSLQSWASKWRMTFNVKKSCIVFFEKQHTSSSTLSSTLQQHPKFLFCNECLPERDSARYLGVIFHKHMKWSYHLDHILPKVRYAVHRICNIIRKDQPPTLPAICELVKTLVHPIISYGFPVVQFNKSQQQKLNSLMLKPIKRSLHVFSTTSHAALLISMRLLDVNSLYKKHVISFSHRINKYDSNPACCLLREEIEALSDPPSSTTARYHNSFVRESLRATESDYKLHFDQNFSSQQLKAAAASDMIQNMLKQKPKAPCVSNFDINLEHPTRLDHHLRADRPDVIALRSRLRFNSSLLNSSLKKKNMRDSSRCDHCGWPDETLEHVLLHCPRYASSRSVFIQSFNPKPPDDELVSICLGMNNDRKIKGRKPTSSEISSASFLRDIASLRPDI
jgi:hypothetical protein